VKAPASPIIPGNPRDRTGSAGILRRALAEINRRYRGLQADILALFDRIPTYAVNDDRGAAVRYGVAPEDLAGIAEQLQATLDRWLTSGREQNRILWWEPYQAEAAQLGTAQTVSNLTRLSEVYAAARSLATVVYSAPYRNRAAIAAFRGYEHWTGLAAEQRTTLAQIVGRAVADGKNPKAVRTEIADALGVSRSRAALYAQTDITNTLREARMAEAETGAADFGLKIGLLWTSAFLPTTRPWHASRSGRVYTPEEVKAFYAERGNRYRCHCATTECLLDADGKPILTKKLQSTMANERATWQSRHGKG
jgi:uncharacterized protein with gpF-like domain